MKRFVLPFSLAMLLVFGIAFAGPSNGNDADGGYSEPVTLCLWDSLPAPAFSNLDHTGLCHLVP